MPPIETEWLSSMLLAGMLIQIIGFHVFYRKYLETIEKQLNEVALIQTHRSYYGDSHLGRRMREFFIMLMIVAPSSYKKFEAIPRWKIERVPRALRFVVKLQAFLMVVTALAAVMLYYFRLRHGI